MSDQVGNQNVGFLMTRLKHYVDTQHHNNLVCGHNKPSPAISNATMKILCHLTTFQHAQIFTNLNIFIQVVAIIMKVFYGKAGKAIPMGTHNIEICFVSFLHKNISCWCSLEMPH